jgi:cyclophilin family peptidyl-prolyl cis-trans isomerase
MTRPLPPLFLRLAAIAVLALPSVSAADHHETTASEGTSDPVFEALDAFVAEESIDKSNPNWKTRLPEPPKQSFARGTTYLWELDTTEGGITVRLLSDSAPMHVTSTIYLTRLGFYDGTAFHRVIPDFMAQGGDPLGNGTGGPGYQYDGEFDTKVRHDKPGLLSMANRGPGTDGSQFFLTFVPTAHLDGKHTIFGEVIEGQATLKKLENFGSSPSGRTTKPLVIKKATIRVQ